jgi:hypothetical protein
MRKFATPVYAKLFCNAVDMLGEAAAGAFVKTQITLYVESKLQKDRCVFPVSAADILALLDEPHVPKTLISTANELVTTQDSLPLSCICIDHLRDLIESLFVEQGGEAVDKVGLNQILRTVIEAAKNSHHSAMKRAMDAFENNAAR